jgi:hypothetical protein
MPGTSSAEQQLVATDGGSCNVPAGVRVSLPSGSGCFAGTPAQICQVSNGATVNVADGAVSGGTETCKPLCGASQYELTCVAAALTAVPPDPDSALGCQGIPIPTPSSSLYYCCPCAD